MDKPILYGIIGALAGILVGIFVARYAVNTQNYGMMNMMGMGRGMMQMMKGDQTSMMGGSGMHGSNMEMSMEGMSSLLATLKGDTFDQTFINLMIDHHEGAIDMARLSLTNSSRKEIKDLSNDIISAQTREIEIMKGWLDEWFGK